MSISGSSTFLPGGGNRVVAPYGARGTVRFCAAFLCDALETGLAGWGGRIRTSASGIVPDWAYRYRAARRVGPCAGLQQARARTALGKPAGHKFQMQRFESCRSGG
jgi:hypothetical protein